MQYDKIKMPVQKYRFSSAPLRAIIKIIGSWPEDSQQEEVIDLLRFMEEIWFYAKEEISELGLSEEEFSCLYLEDDGREITKEEQNNISAVSTLIGKRQ